MRADQQPARMTAASCPYQLDSGPQPREFPPFRVLVTDLAYGHTILADIDHFPISAAAHADPQHRAQQNKLESGEWQYWPIALPYTDTGDNY